MLFSNPNNIRNRGGIFISGCPRSGTSLLTKIIDSHPDIGILMEAILGNRRRHHLRSRYWNDPRDLQKHVQSLYKNISEKIIGNKVCNPDVWSVEDILQFCNLFDKYNIVWIVRDPVDNLRSRYYREPADHYNEAAKKHLPLNYSNKFGTWASSWKQSIENYTRLKEMNPDKVHIVYYDDLIVDFENQVSGLFKRLNIPFHPQVLKWHVLPHYDAKGKKKKDLKYKDGPILEQSNHKVDPSIETLIIENLQSCRYWIEKWKNRDI